MATFVGTETTTNPAEEAIRITLKNHENILEGKKEDLEVDARIYEYTSAANPDMLPVPVAVHSPSLHLSGPTRIIPFDLRERLGVMYRATSPNIMASFIRILSSETISSQANATSQAFYIIRGSGSSSSEFGEITWSAGDLFVLPATSGDVVHTASTETSIYWITDEPLMSYLGVSPDTKKFKPTVFRRERMLAEVEAIRHQPGAEHRNRLGILLGNKITEENTLTLTHTLWSLLNCLPANDAQRPHRHNSVAIDLCVSASAEGVYTLMGPELGPDGWVKDPVRCDWVSGGVFLTPPGWWHSHHNETGEPAWVLPMQDAGLYTHQRTLDIRFSTGPSETNSYKRKFCAS